jgi:Right handed beta helix region
MKHKLVNERKNKKGKSKNETTHLTCRPGAGGSNGQLPALHFRPGEPHAARSARADDETLTQIEPRTPISSLPYTITNPGSYYVTTNLTSPGSGNGITISSGNVTVDLNGFTLQGVPASLDGIYVYGTITNIVVRNGTVTGWGSHGIDAWSGGYPRNMVFEKLTISANAANGLYTEAGTIIRDSIAIGNVGIGFYTQGGEIIGCLARENSGAAFNVVNTSLLHCTAQFNSGYGYYLTSSRAVDCDCVNNSSAAMICDGIGCEIRRCRIINTGNTAIFCVAGGGGHVVQDCEIANSAYQGIYIAGGVGGNMFVANNLRLNAGGGIILNDSNNYVENNHVLSANGVEGIGVSSATYTNNVVVRNVVAGGGSASVNYSFSVIMDAGPIGSASSATSPWANISH